MDLWLILYIFDWMLFVIIAGTVLYMGIFAIAALFHNKPDIPKAKKMNRFVILIPAYMQDQVIEQTVLSVLSQAYPQRMFDVTVISDHQDEITNMKLAQYPITLLTPNFEESTKAKSLQYAILNLPEFKIYDAVVLLDGDNIIDQDFLDQVNDAYEIAATRAIQTHRISKNRDTTAARIDAIFEEINNAIFRRGHISFGLSAALAGSGTVFDFNWFKTNVMRAKTAGEDKELEALLMRQDIFVDYFDDIYVYNERKREAADFNRQRRHWILDQVRSLIKNIRYLPAAIFNQQYDWVDKIIQWMLLPRTILFTIIFVMSLSLPFIYLSSAIKWWIVTAIWGFSMAFATPNALVDKNWDKDFITLPIATVNNVIKRIISIIRKK